jgi:solute carrier family 25 (mitochondrial aspartate/glutamate transporter), member 12/13
MTGFSRLYLREYVFLLLLLLSQRFPATMALTYIPGWVVHTAIGAVAGSAGALAAYPIDYVKSQLQTEQGRAIYRDGWDAAATLIRTQGPLALYRGVGLQLLGVAPEKTIKLTANAYFRSIFVSSESHSTSPLTMGLMFIIAPWMGEILAGGLAGWTQVIVTNPLEVLKVKLQTSNQTLSEVWNQLEGPLALYQGAGACSVRDILFSAILFPLYAHSKVWLLPLVISILGDQHSNGATFWTDLLAGSFAAGPAAAFSTPADVIKTRIQQNRDAISILNQQAESTELLESGFWNVGSALVNKEGVLVLSSGWLERVVRSVPQFGVTLAMFDVLNSLAVENGWLLEGQ